MIKKLSFGNKPATVADIVTTRDESMKRGAGPVVLMYQSSDKPELHNRVVKVAVDRVYPEDRVPSAKLHYYDGDITVGGPLNSFDRVFTRNLSLTPWPYNGVDLTDETGFPEHMTAVSPDTYTVIQQQEMPASPKSRIAQFVKREQPLTEINEADLKKLGNVPLGSTFIVSEDENSIPFKLSGKTQAALNKQIDRLNTIQSYREAGLL